MKTVNVHDFWSWYFDTKQPESDIDCLFLVCSGFGYAFDFDSLEIELTETDGEPVDYHVNNTIEFFGLINATCFLGSEYGAMILVGKYSGSYGEDIRGILNCDNGRKLSFRLPLGYRNWEKLK